MKSLNKILRHKYIVIRRVAEEVYQDNSDAAYDKLLGRSLEKYRYKEEEYKTVATYFHTLAMKLENIQLMPNKKEKIETENMQTLQIPNCIQIKRITEDLQIKYFHLFDQLRNRTSRKKDVIKLLEKKLKKFSAFIKKQLTLALEEANTYKFSLGRGSQSHLDKV